MLEDKRLIRVPKWTKRVMSNNGTNGVSGFIDSVTNPSRKKKVNKFFVSFPKKKKNEPKKIILNSSFKAQNIMETRQK